MILHVGRVARLAGLTALAVVTAASAPEVRATAPPSTQPANEAAAPPSTGPASAAPGAPRILLTNDDGWSEGGLLALYETLLEAGFEVVVFAPDDDETGVSAIVSVDDVEVTRMFDNVFAVDGSPADAVEIGISAGFAGTPPDLVISGPNAGFNIGDAVIHSGSVGGVVTALNDGVTAIAVNAGPNPATSEADFTTTNSFVVDLVAALVANAAGGPLLPPGLGLNVNIPFTGADAPPTGVAITSTDNRYVDPDYSGVELPDAGETVVAEAEVVQNPTLDAGSDSAALASGLVAITFIEGNYDATDPDDRAAQVDALTPVLTAILESAE